MRRFTLSASARLPNDAAEWDFHVHADDYDVALNTFLDGLKRLDTDTPADPIAAAID
jgi:hypothetical protein